MFDEGHHLFDAADSAFSVYLSAQESAELRNWIRGAEDGRRGRARGLKRRIGELLADDPAALADLDSALEAARPEERTRLIEEFAAATESRLRFYAPDGRRLSDSFETGPPTYTLRDPDLQPWKRDAARAMDRGIRRPRRRR